MLYHRSCLSYYPFPPSLSLIDSMWLPVNFNLHKAICICQKKISPSFLLGGVVTLQKKEVILANEKSLIGTLENN